MKKNSRKLLLFALVMPMVFLAKAGTGKTDVPLQGYVTDAVTKKPVPGVVVSIVNNGAIVPKEVTTDADGYFSFTQLPSTLVSIQFEKKGYQSYKKSGVVVTKEKIPVKLNIDFIPEGPNDINDDSEYPLLRMLQTN
ncbi:MAG: carboxypeptidase regulatory-like domain-containing protein [Bacteroidetes bacterium]|nr:carboxypeptidase regulatory-like domain-containing protein [Bacteroidota bacterium]MBS1934878.1 carboxypeptidase regulatory-like domain-containing protein [Bacteroidota bacterium]